MSFDAMERMGVDRDALMRLDAIRNYLFKVIPSCDDISYFAFSRNYWHIYVVRTDRVGEPQWWCRRWIRPRQRVRLQQRARE